MFGLMAYPAQGIYKSMKGAKGFESSLLQSKCAMVDRLATQGGTAIQIDEVLSAFDKL